MKTNAPLQIIFAFFLFSQFSFAQVDVVYNDLVWSDEFNTNGAVDSNNWFQQTQLPAGGSWNNGEVQHYTNQLTNSFVDAGLLNIVAKKETYTDQGVTKNYTSARLNSKYSFTYGRVDVRAKLPLEAGTWPAIWLLGKNINEPGGYFSSTYGTTNWPACGETDIMEHGIFGSQSVNYVQSTLHTPSSYGNSVNNGGIVASDLANNYHIYSMNWSPNQISFLLDGVIYYTYNPAVKDATTWPFDKEQYLLLNVAMGGVAGTIAANFTQSSMLIDYVRVYQNTTIDTQAPTNFTASVGTISGSSVELVLNGLDNSGNVTYNVDYGSGTSSTFSPSGVQKSLIISNLSSNTNYTFTVTATDASGNTAVNNPIVLSAKTTTILQCSGNASTASQGSFSTGYNYSFETIGTNVKITFELLDTDKVGVVAYLWKQTPFTETAMSNVSGKIFTSTIAGQTIGSTISYAVKFAYSGGMSVTKYFTYVVGSNCTLGIESPLDLKNVFYPNPVHNTLFLKLTDNKNRIVLTDVLGQKLIDYNVPSSYSLDMIPFKIGIYFLSIENTTGIQQFKIIKE
ncbi:family 16 glycosylhydrolase [Flavobacterium sp.]|uniref:family 16 glycosylhydrolase n=1 Tax=Flavobacterium sp. TaxID=239 RepID=UPI0037BDC0A3